MAGRRTRRPIGAVLRGIPSNPTIDQGSLSTGIDALRRGTVVLARRKSWHVEQELASTRVCQDQARGPSEIDPSFCETHGLPPNERTWPTVSR